MTILPQSPPSLWLAEYEPYTPSPPLVGDLAVDVAIVGGGFQGLATAIAVRRAAPALRVAVLEHEVVGYGASGRNGSFAMTVVGLGFGVMARLKGHAFMRDAHRYMERAVDGLEALVREHGLACDMIRPGFLRMALAPAHVRRLRDETGLIGSPALDDSDDDQHACGRGGGCPPRGPDSPRRAMPRARPL
jgi:glycine/D-amino acid oxidase-like deaminating enzyme